jgi:hypothetical protein
MLSRIAFLLLFAAVTSFAQSENRPAWTWTSAERIAKRLDNHNIAERRRVEAAGSSSGAESIPAFVINGSHDPELFLPSELVAMLLSDLDMTSNGSSHILESYTPSLLALEMPPRSFWRDLRFSAGDYFELAKRDGGGKYRSKDVSRQLCGQRAEALSTMREKYSRFDEFLYLAVAPKKTLVSGEATSGDWLLWVDRGCR